MWITNGGFADLFIVFARIENDKNISCFLLEKEMKGVVLGNEEPKMGLNGSSTRMVFFEEVKVPIENQIGIRGGGFKIAVNCLNVGRIKMGAAETERSKCIISLAV